MNQRYLEFKKFVLYISFGTVVTGGRQGEYKRNRFDDFLKQPSYLQSLARFDLMT
jgi:hypothetical protein